MFLSGKKLSPLFSQQNQRKTYSTIQKYKSEKKHTPHSISLIEIINVCYNWSELICLFNAWRYLGISSINPSHCYFDFSQCLNSMMMLTISFSSLFSHSLNHGSFSFFVFLLFHVFVVSHLRIENIEIFRGYGF